MELRRIWRGERWKCLGCWGWIAATPCSAEEPLADTATAAHTAAMFLRRHTKLIGQDDYTYWSLVKSIRTAKGSRHQVVAHLGKLTPDETQQAHEWSDLDALLDGAPPAQQLPLGGVSRKGVTSDYSTFARRQHCIGCVIDGRSSTAGRNAATPR